MKVLCQNPLCDGKTPVGLPEGATRCCFCGDMYKWHDVDFEEIRKQEMERIAASRAFLREFAFAVSFYAIFFYIVSRIKWRTPIMEIFVLLCGLAGLALFAAMRAVKRKIPPLF